ncbi:hypothetical protein EPN44_11100 [bacterium]|nr:MAG: hypothetical protein EPN44_11100 [bacterium]
MARFGLARRALVAALLAVLVAAPLAMARAAEYRLLHVRTLAVSVDRTQAHIGGQLHLTVRTAVGERVEALPELILPDLTAFQVLADAERVEHAASGTTFVAVLTIAPNLPGSSVIGPAYLDAIDPGTHRALRYRSNTVVVTALASAPSQAREIIAQVHRLLPLDILFVLAVIVGSLWLLRPRAEGTVAVAPPRSEPSTPALPASEGLGVWVERLRAAPTRANAAGARAALWARLGARERETAQDVLGRLSDPTGRSAVAAAERAAFVEPAREAAAARDLADALARLVG